MRKVVLGLGSNQGDRVAHLRDAISRLRALGRVISVSPLYESDAMLLEGAAAEWNLPFLNLALLIETNLAPEQLLSKVKAIEIEVGRSLRGKWAPREIDIDILSMEGVSFTSESLKIPHSGLLDRPFALLPLLDLQPEWSPEEGGRITDREQVWRFGGPEQVPFHTRRAALGLMGLMGVLNITPDSFSDGGCFNRWEDALTQAERLVRAGSCVLDVGAESTRPGSVEVDADLEWRRLEPILTRLRELRVDGVRPALSVDTRHADTALRALALGVEWINDVTGGEDEKLVRAVAASSARLVFMHSLGIPPRADRVLEDGPDPVSLLLEWAAPRVERFVALGVPAHRLIFDPGIGFGKTPEQTLKILRSAHRFHELGVEVLVGPSRKSFMKRWTDVPTEERDLETALIATALADQGINYARVHDVALSARALATRALLRGATT